MTSAVTHVEMYDTTAFCGADAYAIGPPVVQSDWHEEPEAIQSATCPECLARIYMLGDSAALALGRLGLKIEVRDATEAEASPS